MTETPPDAARAAERAAAIAAGVAALLALVKLGAGLLTGSLAVAASSLDSFMDALASGTNALALRWSRREPTRVYAFGYGKLQALAALLQGLLIAASAVGLAWKAVERLREPRPLGAVGWGVAAMLLTILASAGLTVFLRRSAARTATPLLAVDALHYASDFWANAGALSSLALSRIVDLPWFDPLLSVAIGAWVLKGAMAVTSGAVGELLDHGLPEEEVAKVGEVVARYAPDVKGFHDLRTRRSGHRRYFDFHVVIRPDLPFTGTHALTDRIIKDLEALWPGADVTVHADPEPDARLSYGGQG